MKKSWVILLLNIFLLSGFTSVKIPLDKDDQKNLEKSAKYNKQKQELEEKANAIYSRLSEYDRSDESNTKKIEKLEKEAMELQIEAMNIGGNANELEYGVYNKVINKLKANFERNNNVSVELKLLEEKARENFLKAENYRDEANRLSKDEMNQKFLKLSEAQKLEVESIETQKELIQYYTGEKNIEFGNQEAQTGQLNEVVINEDLLKSYLDYVISNDTLVLMDQFRNLVYAEQLTSSNIRNVLDNYNYSDIFYAEQTDSLDFEIVADVTTKESLTDNTKKSTVDKKSVLDGAIYKVQIASNKSPLSQNHLKAIYDGNKKVKMISEEGWYKYSIGDFNSYAEAEEFMQSLKIKDAFVVAYTDSKKVDLSVANKSVRSEEKIKTSSADINFKVQIAAGREKLSEEKLLNIYNGDETVNMVFEDDWYKYSIGNYTEFNEAKILKSKINVKDAFIVAYKNGKKVPLYLAKKGLVEDESKQEITFKVQIAADTRAMSSEKLNRIYSGSKNITTFNEDGWVKYSIGAYSSFNEADELRKSSGVDGAFVIAFRGDEKMDVLDAKRQTRCLDPHINKKWLKENVGLVFKVQIAASLRELTESEIKNICCIERDVYLTHEDEWYRYSIGSFSSYEGALKLKRISKVNGAFIVSYKDKSKISLEDAKKIINK